MPDPLKKQIMDRIAADLAPLKPATFRDITRELDAVRDAKALPALMIYDGPETTVAKTTTQWTCRFPVYFKIVFVPRATARPPKTRWSRRSKKKSKPT